MKLFYEVKKKVLTRHKRTCELTQGGQNKETMFFFERYIRKIGMIGFYEIARGIYGGFAYTRYSDFPNRGLY